MQQQQLFPTVANHMTPMKETVKGTNHFQPPPPTNDGRQMRKQQGRTPFQYS